jgi:short-subunit dehydrogenase
MMNATESQSARSLRVMITGASRGIGAAIAQELAPRAAWVCLVGRDHRALEAVRAGLGAVRCAVISGDLREAATVQSIEAAVDAEGGLDLLVNNAGISDFGAFVDQDPAMVARLVEVNLISPMLLAHRLLPALRRGRDAQIVNIGSSFAYIGYPGFTAYCATKFGLRGFSEALARELWGTGIRVRLFSPRATSTGINSEAVQALNRDLGVSEDSTQDVARQFAAFLQGNSDEYRVGWPEKLFTRLNQCLPSVVGGALRKQMPRMREAWKATKKQTHIPAPHPAQEP